MMEPYTKPLPLACGATITVHAWPGEKFSACYSDYRRLLRAFAEQAVSDSTDAPQQLLLDRVIAAAVPDPEDRALIAAPDLDALLDLLYSFNRVEEVAAKSLSLYQRLVQAEAIAQAQATTTTPS